MLGHWFALSLFAGPCWALLMLGWANDTVSFVCLDFLADHLLSGLCREKCSKELLVIDIAAPSGPSHALWPVSRASRSFSGLNWYCWFVKGVCEWTEILLPICMDWIANILTTKIGITQVWSVWKKKKRKKNNNNKRRNDFTKTNKKLVNRSASPKLTIILLENHNKCQCRGWTGTWDVIQD